MLRVGIIAGSTRPGRKSRVVAQWVYNVGRERDDAELEVVDLADFNLPLLDEPMPPSLGRYTREHTIAWAAKVREFDAFVFVTPEYNHSPSAALKNAIDFLFGEWNNKAAGIVSYGAAGGVTAADHLRVVLSNVMVATVRAYVGLSLFTDFENLTTFTPAPRREKELDAMLDQLVAWGRAMRMVRGLPIVDVARGVAERDAA